MAEWHEIHDFMRGWGLQEVIPDNFVTTAEGGPTAENPHVIPYRIGYSRQPERVLYARDVWHFLREDLFTRGVDPEDVYTRLQPLLAAEQQRVAALPPICFDRITIPRVRQAIPPL